MSSSNQSFGTVLGPNQVVPAKLITSNDNNNNKIDVKDRNGCISTRQGTFMVYSGEILMTPYNPNGSIKAGYSMSFVPHMLSDGSWVEQLAAVSPSSMGWAAWRRGITLEVYALGDQNGIIKNSSNIWDVTAEDQIPIETPTQ